MRFIVLTLILTSAYGAYPRVKISEGELSGITYTLPNGREVQAFLGIPYATPPIGSNRFKAPKPPKPWKGVRNATSPGHHCIQTGYRARLTKENHIETTGDEDCLFLNVFTPKLVNNSNNEDDLMNVLVSIHGGAFMFGTGNTAFPDYILQNDNIVYVSLNYRLGVLGFFSTDHHLAAGNYGLKDQVEALRWVQRNIRSFGGNPAKVTIMGCSAGGASVHYHMISPTTKGLFRSAISSSGTVSLPWSLPAGNANASKEFASSLNCGYRNIFRKMKCLRNKPIAEIMDEGYGKYTKNGAVFGDFPYGPVIEVEHRYAYLSENPKDLIKAGKIKHVPWMISVTENEGAFLGLETIENKMITNRINNHWNEISPRMFKYDDPVYSEYKRDYVSAAIRKYYLPNTDLSPQNARKFYQALGDRHFYNGIIETAKLYSSASLENTYCYKFYYRGTESMADMFSPVKGKNYGCLHCENMYYVLKSINGKAKTNNDKDMAKLLSSTIIAFMKNGNPNVPQLGANWQPISDGNGAMNCLGIYSYTVQRMEDIENHNTTRFWNDILPPQNNDGPV